METYEASVSLIVRALVVSARWPARSLFPSHRMRVSRARSTAIGAPTRWLRRRCPTYVGPKSMLLRDR
jgi:hypothetical protein